MTIISSGTTSFYISGTGGSYTLAGYRTSTTKAGVRFTGTNDTLTNSGTITGEGTAAGGAIFVGVPNGAGSVIINLSGGTIKGTGTTSYTDGIDATYAGATIINSGLISGNGEKFTNGIDFLNLTAAGVAVVTNTSTGIISGGGVYVHGSAGTIVNSGQILGDTLYGAVYFKNGGTVTNLAGTISATAADTLAAHSYGIKIIGGPGTITNAGLISAASAAGAGIILTAGFTNRLIVDPGASFVGSVDGGAAATSTIEFAPGTSVTTGTLSLGTQFTNFGTLAFDSGKWLVKGTTTDALGTAASITGLVTGDTLDLGGFVATSETFVASNDLVLTNAANTHFTLAVTGSFATNGFSIAPDGSGGTNLMVICFGKGTRIDTPSGEVRVETLVAGDMVLTAHNGPRAVKWVGKGKVLSTRGKRTAATPVIVRKGALADNVPTADLHVTKAHSLYIDGVLIPVEFLVNHKTIIWDDQAKEIEIYHVELDSHDVLIANGTMAESYRDDGNRWLFQNANSGWGSPPQEPYAPVLTGGPVVDAIWQRLLDRAGARDLPPLTNDPDLHLIVDGQRLDAREKTGETYTFRLPNTPASVVLASRETVPAELGFARDPRSLGVALRRVTLAQGPRLALIEADDDRLTAGFHDYEAEEHIRWTNGYAELPIEAFARFNNGADLIVQLGGATQYPDFGESPVSVAA